MATYTPSQLTAFNTPSDELLSHVKARPIVKSHTTDMIAARHERAAYLAKLRHLTPYTSPDPAVAEHDVFISATGRLSDPGTCARAPQAHHQKAVQSLCSSTKEDG